MELSGTKLAFATLTSERVASLTMNSKAMFGLRKSALTRPSPPGEGKACRVGQFNALDWRVVQGCKAQTVPVGEMLTPV